MGSWLRGLSLGCMLLAGLTASGAVLALDRIKIELGGAHFELEYVADPQSRRLGLMGRPSLPAGTGMLFDFPDGTTPAIWMRNMQISLDLVYIDANGTIAQIFPRVPPCQAMPCEVYHASRPLRFVLELPAGTAGTESGRRAAGATGHTSAETRPTRIAWHRSQGVCQRPLLIFSQ